MSTEAQGDAVSPFEVLVDAPKDRARVGEWYPLELTIKNVAALDDDKAPNRLELGSVHLDESEMERLGLSLDESLVLSETIGPKEALRLTLRLRAARPGVINLDAIKLDFDGVAAGAALLPPLKVPVEVSFTEEIEVAVESIYAVEGGLKARVEFVHKGTVPFSYVSIDLGPPGTVLSGRTELQWLEFGPGRREEVTLFVAGEELSFDAKFTGCNERYHHVFVRPVPRLEAPPESPFRFIEVRNLRADARRAWPLPGRGDDVEPKEKDVLRPDPATGDLSLINGQSYVVEITTGDRAARTVELREIPGTAHVRHKSSSPDRSRWRFIVDVATEGLLFSKPDQFYYDVVEDDGQTRGGQVPLRLRPSRLKHFKLAGTLGAAITLQGAYRLAKGALDDETGLVAIFEQFDVRSDYPLLFLASIPVTWFALWLYDWVQYRVQSGA